MDVIIAVSKTETVYAAVSLGDGRYRTRRCRVPGRDGELQREFIGVLLPVAVGAPGTAPEKVIRCGTRTFERLAGAVGAGVRLAVGGDETSGVHEVSAPLSEVHRMDPDRSWVIEPMLRAFRNGDREWREFMEPLTCELGDEGIQDEETGSLAAGAIERFYRRRLEAKALARLKSARRRGFELEPRHVLVSNEDLPAALLEVPELGIEAQELDAARAAPAETINGMLASVLAAELPLPARVVLVRQKHLEAALLQAVGPGMKLVDPKDLQRLGARKRANRIAAGLDSMLRAVKMLDAEPLARVA